MSLRRSSRLKSPQMRTQGIVNDDETLSSNNRQDNLLGTSYRSRRHTIHTTRPGSAPHIVTRSTTSGRTGTRSSSSRANQRLALLSDVYRWVKVQEIKTIVTISLTTTKIEMTFHVEIDHNFELGGNYDISEHVGLAVVLIIVQFFLAV